jgi:hypothetical protein
MRELEFKTALHTLLTGWPALQAATNNTTWGLQAESEQLLEENVHVGDVRAVREYHQLSRTPHFVETIVARVVVQVMWEGDNQRATEERAWALAYEIDNALADDRTLGDAFIGHPRPPFVSSTDQANFVAGDRWVATVTVEVTTDART